MEDIGATLRFSGTCFLEGRYNYVHELIIEIKSYVNEEVSEKVSEKDRLDPQVRLSSALLERGRMFSSPETERPSWHPPELSDLNNPRIFSKAADFHSKPQPRYTRRDSASQYHTIASANSSALIGMTPMPRISS